MNSPVGISTIGTSSWPVGGTGVGVEVGLGVGEGEAVGVGVGGTVAVGSVVTRATLAGVAAGRLPHPAINTAAEVRVSQMKVCKDTFMGG